MIDTSNRDRPTIGPDRAEVLAQVAADLLKLRTVRTPMVLVAVGVGLTGVLAMQALLRSGVAGAPSVGTAALLLTMLSTAARAQLIALVVGVLAVSAERRHATLTGTLLQTPRRVPVMVAKSVTAAFVALVLGLLNLGVAVSVAAGSGVLRPSLVNADVVLAVAGQLLAYPLYGLLGAGIGAVLMDTQPIAVLLPTAWFLLLEAYVSTLAPGLSRWLPGPLTAALANAGDLPNLVPVGAGALGLLGYGLLVAGAGTARLTSTDVH